MHDFIVIHIPNFELNGVYEFKNFPHPQPKIRFRNIHFKLEKFPKTI